uniref:Cytoplasmic protein 1 (Fragments) n=1 Tax=Cereibacter sphaeroides TaxID=1063 RepID=Q9R664_CERSP
AHVLKGIIPPLVTPFKDDETIDEAAGIIPPLVTPFKDDETIDEAALR